MNDFPSCAVCATPTHHPNATLCRRCKKMADRGDTRKGPDGGGRQLNKPARRRALKRAFWDGAFHCYFTKVELVEDEWPHYRYLTFEHLTPGDESSVVVASALINRMKTDLDEGEFERLVRALADSFDGAEFDRDAIPDRTPRVPDQVRVE